MTRRCDMVARHFDPASDSYEELASLNPLSSATQRGFARLYAARPFLPENVIVLEHDGRLVGVAHILDAGFPFVVVDGIYIKPEHRSLPNALMLLRAIDDEIALRGVPFYVCHADPRLAHALSRYGFRGLGPDRFQVLVKAPGRGQET